MVLINARQQNYFVLVLREFSVGPAGNVSLFNTFLCVARFTRSLSPELYIDLGFQLMMSGYCVLYYDIVSILLSSEASNGKPHTPAKIIVFISSPII